MTKPLAYLGQVLVYGLIALVLGTFADSPAYVHFPDDQAQIVLSFSHGGQRKEECRRRSADEIAEMAPNMRTLEACPRERLPVLVELELDDEALLREWLAPTGLSSDGRSQIYRRFTVTPGRHRLVARLRDSNREAGFDYERAEWLELSPRQSLAIDFRSEFGGFLFVAGSETAAQEGE